jgi:hypothetical protein
VVCLVGRKNSQLKSEVTLSIEGAGLLLQGAGGDEEVGGDEEANERLIILPHPPHPPHPQHRYVSQISKLGRIKLGETPQATVTDNKMRLESI